MIDRLLLATRPQKATIEPQKAITGPGAAVMSWGTPLADVTRSAHQTMKDAQAVYARGNRWVKRAEMTISARVGGVPWHLETDDGESVGDESSPQLKAIRDLFEQPLPDYTYPSQPKTRRELWGLTSRHMGLCNVGYWYLDEIDRLMGWPQRIFFIRPDRMTAEESGGRLTGWTLDKDAQGGGNPLSIEEVLPFYLDQPDRGFYGTGLVESIMSTTGLPNAIDRHAIDTLSSGGRLPGLYAPKEPGNGDEVFDRMVSDLRTIKDMPDSSKRDIVARMPVDFTPTAADMSGLIVTALAAMSRDDTLAHWGVPLSTIGGYTPAGMNSGETRKYDEAALWQNAVAFRVDALWETIQYRLLDRLKAGGIQLTLVIEEPTFDDDAPKYELAQKATNIPMTTKERRAILGLPPLGRDDLDNAIVLPMQIVEYGTSVSSRPSDDIPLAGAQADVEPQKASLDRELARMKDVSTARLTKQLKPVLAAIGKDIADRVRANYAVVSRKPADTGGWMPEKKRRAWETDFARVLNPQLSFAAEAVSKRVERRLGRPSGKADLLGSAVLARMMKSVGKRITGILDTTRDDVRGVIEQGLKDGLGAAELGDRIEQAAAFDEYRAELIARTETATVLNEAALGSYREYGVETVRAIDGDEDEECAARDGQEFSIDDAEAIQDHPNGTLDWVPVLSTGKAAPLPPAPIVDLSEFRAELASMKAMLTMPRETAQPVVIHNHPPEIDVTPFVDPIVDVMRERDERHEASMKALAETPHNVFVDAPNVTVNVPEQAVPQVTVNVPEAQVTVNVPEQKAALVQQIEIVKMPERVSSSLKEVKRGPNGLITEVREKTVDEDG